MKPFIFFTAVLENDMQAALSNLVVLQRVEILKDNQGSNNNY
jgi:hypothetical protein